MPVGGSKIRSNCEPNSCFQLIARTSELVWILAHDAEFGSLPHESFGYG